MRGAAIDVGTNSTRLLIIEYIKNEIKVLKREREITRLGQGVDLEKKLNKEAINRTIVVLKKYAKIISEYEVDEIKVYGTSALRDVNNSDFFKKKLKQETELNLEVISGEKEASLIYDGASFDLITDNFLIIDIGGGSTEFIWKNNNKINLKSINIGAVRLTERFIKNPNKKLHKDEYMKIKNKIINEVKSINLSKLRKNNIVGVGGTITTLAAMDLGLISYDRNKIHNYELSKKNIDVLKNKLMKSSIEERKQLNGLEKKRADIIIAGVVILDEIMNILSQSNINISEKGILYGMIKEILQE